MSYVYCAYLPFCDFVSLMGNGAHHVGEGRFLLMSTGRICAFFATMIAVTVGPSLVWVARGRRLGAPTAPTGAASASTSADAVVAVVDSMVWSVGEL